MKKRSVAGIVINTAWYVIGLINTQLLDNRGREHLFIKIYGYNIHPYIRYFKYQYKYYYVGIENVFAQPWCRSIGKLLFGAVQLWRCP